MRLEIKTKEFVAWLKTKKQEEVFNYTDVENCCLCQFVKETMGLKEFHCNNKLMWPTRDSKEDSDGQPIPPLIAEAVNTYESTFGSVLRYLEDSQKEMKL